jgi:hypothetical protein
MVMKHRKFGRCLALVALGLSASFSLAPFAAGAATATNRAGVIVDEGNGTVKRVGITFSGTISGITALQLAGFSPTVRGFGGIGGAVCAIDIGGTRYGCPSDSTCLTCDDPDYWSYSRAAAGSSSFTTSRVGAGSTQVHNGDIEGWRWGTGDTPTYVTLNSFFPPPTTTTVPAPPTSTTHVTSPRGTTPHGPSTTSPPAQGQQVGGTASSTTATTGSAANATAGKGAAGHATTTTHRHGATTAGASSSGSSADARAGPNDGARKLAASPPVVHTSSGGSPTGWIAFAVIVALFAVAIVAAHRRRTRAATD